MTEIQRRNKELVHTCVKWSEFIANTNPFYIYWDGDVIEVPTKLEIKKYPMSVPENCLKFKYCPFCGLSILW